MKIIKFIFIFFVITLTIVLAAAFIFIKTFDINRYKPQIISKASQTLKRDVDFDRIDLGVSLSQGINFKISNLSITEDPAFGRGDFLFLKEASCGVDILGYISKKEINISNILIDSPSIAIIRQNDGSINVQSLLAKIQEDTAAGKSAKSKAPVFLPAFLISSLKGSDGEIKFIDYSFTPPLTFEISDLDFLVNKISLTEVFPFSAEAAVWSKTSNIKLEGKAQFDIKSGEITISDLKGKTDLAQILLDKIPVSLPMVKDMIMPQDIGGNLQVDIKKLTAGPKGLGTFKADVSLVGGRAQFSQIALPIKDLRMDIVVTQDEIVLEKASADIGQGSIQAQGSIEDYLSKQYYNFGIESRNLNIGDIVSQDKSPVKVEGIAFGKANLKGIGFNPQAIKTTLSGEANLSVEKAKLKNINVLTTVLDKISIIPGLREKFQESLPERFKQKLTQKDTLLADIKLPIVIKDGRAVINNANFAADEFIFKGKGEAGFDGAFSLEGSFLIPEDLSQSMVSVVDELEYLLDKEKQIYIPLRVSGRAADLTFSVDGEYITKKILADQAQKQILKVLDKVIGKDEEKAVGQEAPQEGAAKEPTEKEIIGGILREIFKQKNSP